MISVTESGGKSLHNGLNGKDLAIRVSGTNPNPVQQGKYRNLAIEITSLQELIKKIGGNPTAKYEFTVSLTLQGITTTPIVLTKTMAISPDKVKTPKAKKNQTNKTP